MKPLISIILFLFSTLVYSQHTQRFKNLTKVLEKTEVKTDTVFYSNVKPKFITVRTKFEYDGGIVKTNIGTTHVFYRNGRIARITQRDEFGNYLNEKLFDRKGNLTEERITTEIDNRAENIEDYLESESFGDFKKTINYYKFSRKTKSWYKYKEEFLNLINRKFEETQKFLNENGQIIETKTKSYAE